MAKSKATEKAITVEKKKSEKALSSPKKGYGVTNYSSSETNIKYVSYVMQIGSLGDVDMSSPESVSLRLEDYFNITINAGLQPLVPTMAIALNMSTQQLEALHSRRARYSESVCKIIDKAYQSIEAIQMALANDGMINPITYQFNMRNLHGYINADKPAVNTTNPLGEAKTIEQIKAKYGDMPDD